MGRVRSPGGAGSREGPAAFAHPAGRHGLCRSPRPVRGSGIPCVTPARTLHPPAAWNRATPALDRRSTGDPGRCRASRPADSASPGGADVRRESPIPAPACHGPQGVPAPLRAERRRRAGYAKRWVAVSHAWAWRCGFVRERSRHERRRADTARARGRPARGRGADQRRDRPGALDLAGNRASDTSRTCSRSCASTRGPLRWRGFATPIPTPDRSERGRDVSRSERRRAGLRAVPSPRRSWCPLLRNTA